MSARGGVLPTFIIPGAAKAGTYTLWHYLDSHPDVLMSSRKEPGYFHLAWEQGLEHYQQSFSHYDGQAQVGEATASYLASRDAPARIHGLLPDVKFVVALRDPVSRTVSHYWWKVNHGNEHRSLDEVLDGGRQEFIIDRSLYFEHVTRFLEFFPLEQFHFVVTERMSNSLRGALAEVFAFIGVDKDAPVVTGPPMNRASASRSQFVNKLFTGPGSAGVMRGAAAVAPWARPAARRVRSFAMRWNTRSFSAPELRPDQNERLQELFAPDVEALEALIGYEFSDWPVRSRT